MELGLKKVHIDEIGRIVTGNTPPKSNSTYFCGKYPWIKPTDIELDHRYVDKTEETYSELAFRKYEECLLPPMSTCVVTIGTVGEKICLTKEPSFTNQSINAIIPNADVYDPMFVYYLMKYNLPKVAKRNPGTASGRHHVSKSNFSSISVNVPPYPIQKKISAALAPFDDLIEINEKRIEILQEIPKLIYTEWFVHFRYPGYEKMEIAQTPRGPIPEGWRWEKIGKVISLEYGKGLKKECRNEGDYPVYGSSGIVGSHAAYLVEGPAVIVGRKGNVGSVHWCYDNCYPIDTVYYVKTDLSLYYVYQNFQNQNFINSDAAVPGLSRSQAYALPILIPSSDLLTEFDNHVETVFQRIYQLKKKNEYLHQIRTLLLPNLISGEIDVNRLDLDLRGE